MKNVEDIYPLSPLQQALLYHRQTSNEPGVGFEQTRLDLEGSLDPEALERAWQWVTGRHPALRTVFVIQRVDEPLQVVRRRVRIPFQVEDWRLPAGEAEAAKEIEASVTALMAEDQSAGFDLLRGPLLRVHLLRLEGARWALIWSWHHLIMDAWCESVVLEEVFGAYRAFAAGRDPDADGSLSLARPFRDYIAWLAGRDQAAAEEFWRRRLEGVREPTPLGVPRSWAADEDRGARPPGVRDLGVRLSPAAADCLRAVVREHRWTLGTLVYAAWALVLSRYSGRSRVLFGITVSGRPAELPGVEGIVGMFINNLPVTTAVPAEGSSAAWLETLHHDLVRLRDFDYCSPVQLRRWSGVAGVERLFESLVVYQNTPQVEVAEEMSEEALAVSGGQTRLHTGLPLTLVAGAGAGLDLLASYEARLFERSTIARLLGHWMTSLEALADGLDRAPGELPMLTAPERHQLVVEWEAASILDHAGRPVPIGVIGRLEDAGPHGLGVWTTRGEAERLGSSDLEADLAGVAVPLWRVEAVLRRYPGLREVAAAVVPAPSGDRLVAYLVADREGPSPESLRRFLKRQLPERWRPAVFITLDALPRTADGNLDRCALPSPESTEARVSTAVAGPTDPVELRLVRLWEEVFGLRPVSIDDDFFALGGHSTLAIVLTARIREEFGRDLPLASLLENPTIRSQAVALWERGNPVSESALVPIQPGQAHRTPLFCVHPIGGGVFCYSDLAYCLGSDRPVFGLKAPGWQDEQEPLDSIEAMAELYARTLRESGWEGPYHLAGWSFGGVVALELAQQLRSCGAEVPLLAILDTELEEPDSSKADDAEFLYYFLGGMRKTFPLEVTAEELREQGNLDQQIAYVLERGRMANLLPETLDMGPVERFFGVFRAASYANARYRPQRYGGAVTLFRCREEERESEDSTLGWDDLAHGKVDTIEVPGRHDRLVYRPWVEGIAAHLGDRLRDADGAHEPPRAAASRRWALAGS